MRVRVGIEYDTHSRATKLDRPKGTGPALAAIATAVQSIAANDLGYADEAGSVTVTLDSRGRLRIAGTRDPGVRIALFGKALQGIAENELAGIGGQGNGLIIPATRLPAGPVISKNPIGEAEC